MAAAGTQEKGWLSKAFTAVAKTVTIGVVAAVAWQIFLDPMFFPLFHDTTNIIAQAWVMKINELFSWIPQAVGLSKAPGLLTPVMKGLLGKEIAILTPPSGNALADTFASTGGLSLDAIMQ